MKKFKELNMNEQHREKGRFHPTIPRTVQSVATATPRKESDSADVKLKEEAGDTVNMDSPVGSQHREGDSPAARTMREKPQREPMKSYKKFNEETLEEGRPSQRHPLEGHDYHKKSNDELVHIAKDAHAAAEAMKSHNTTAENKYRDQANDSATVRHWRKMNGTPNWYKKKYGLSEGAFSSGALKPPKEWLDAAKKIPSKGTVRDKDEKGVYTAQTVNGKEVSRKYDESYGVCPVCGCTPCNCTHIDLQEGKMGQIHADIGEHLDKHIADYKAHGGAEHLGSKTVKAAGHIAKLHGIEQKHAQKFVNDYVESKLKEEVEMDEAWNQPNYSQSIQARQAKADEDKLPFKPEKGVKHSTPGKFGSGYSTARNLARQALKQQAAKLKPMKESEESRKVAIVKDVAKKAKKKVEAEDKFNPDPVLSSDIQKQ